MELPPDTTGQSKPETNSLSNQDEPATTIFVVRELPHADELIDG